MTTSGEKRMHAVGCRSLYPDHRGACPMGEQSERRVHGIGVGSDYTGRWSWVCACGAESRKAFDDRWEAGARGMAHIRRSPISRRSTE